MQRELAERIPLEVWQDPQGEVVLHTSDRKTHIYFGCWEESGSSAGYLAKMTFECCLATNFVRSDYAPYKIIGKENHSYILDVPNSKWLKALSESRKERNHNVVDSMIAYNGKRYRHFVVVGHDVYVDVIATGFGIEKIDRSNAGELVYLIDNA